MTVQWQWQQQQPLVFAGDIWLLNWFDTILSFIVRPPWLEAISWVTWDEILQEWQWQRHRDRRSRGLYHYLVYESATMTVATAAATATIYHRRSHIPCELIRYDFELHRLSSLARSAIRFVAGWDTTQQKWQQQPTFCLLPCLKYCWWFEVRLRLQQEQKRKTCQEVRQITESSFLFFKLL